MDIEMMKLGLAALSRAGQTSWFDGHFGGAILAGNMLLERNGFSEEVKLGIRDQMAKAIQTRPELFTPHNSSSVVLTNAKEKIVTALVPNIHNLSVSGHGVIYGALALRVIHAFPEFGTEEIVSGIQSLLQKTLKDKKNRYYGIEDYQNFNFSSNQLAEYNSIEEMILTTFSETRELYKDGYVDSNFYFFTAEKLHSVTMAHAITTLWDLNYRNLAIQALKIHRQAIILNRMIPPTPETFRVTEREPIHPYQENYWRKDHFDDHILKLALSTLELLDRLPENKVETVYNQNTFWAPFQR